MRNKTVASILALVLGVFGIHRFYLGQFLRGLLYLVYPIILLTIVFQLTGFLQVVRQEASLSSEGVAPFLLLFLLIPLFDFIWLLVMSREKFNKKYNHQQIPLSKTLLYSTLVLVAGVGFNYLAYQQFYVPPQVEVQGTPADFQLTAKAFTSEFTNDEQAAREKYKGKIVQMTGKVETEGTELGKEGDQRVLILEGDGNLTIRCQFNTSEQEKVQAVKIGETITVKGTFSGVMVFDVELKDCYLVETEN